MRIVVIGQAAFGKSVIQSLCDAGEEVVAVFCPVDLEHQRVDPIKEEALFRGIKVLQFGRMRDEAAINAFLDLSPDLCVMAFVTDFVPDRMLQAPKQGTIQYHPSMLPLHRGPSSINWPIIKGELTTGVSIFWPDDGLDTGPILMQKTTVIDPDDTVGSLYYKKLYPLGVQGITESVALIHAGEAPKIPQDHELATYESWCGVKEGRINWDEQGRAIYDLIRGCDPRPGASGLLGANHVYFHDVGFEERLHDITAGTVTVIDDDGFWIAVRGGLIHVATVRVDGTGSPAGSWARVNIAVGDRFMQDLSS
jgi:methionyl-tRNA formyltransferase